MFGYLRPFQNRMKKDLQTAYKNYYCGTCFTLQHNYGLSSALLLSYDVVLFGLSLKSLEQPMSERLPCFGEKKAKKQFVNEKWKVIASISMLLVAEKLRDDIEDENSILAKIAFCFYSKKIRKASFFATTPQS